MPFGVMPCSKLNAVCLARRRSVSPMALRMDSVILSAYKIAIPSVLRAALPMV